MAGRPEIYTEELGIRICEAIATSSKGMHRLHKEHDWFPAPKTIINWLLTNKYPEFSKQYASAREEQAEFIAEETLEISDDNKRDDEEFVGANHVQRARLRIDTRKWIASKLKPKKYGDKLDITTDGDKIIQPIIKVIDTDGQVLDGKL